MLAKFRSWRDVTGCQRGSRSWYAPLSLRDARPARNEKHIEVRRCRRMSPVSRVPPSRDDPRPRKPRSRPSAMPCRDRSRDASIAVIFRGGQAPRSRASRAAPARRARAVPVPARQKIRRTRAIARRVARGGRYAARGVVTHATIVIQRFGGRSFSRHLFSIGRGRARRATRLRPPKRGSRVAAGSRASAARSHAAPLIATPSLTDPTPARLSHDRAANSSDRAEVRASRVESRSETRRARVRRVWGFSRRTTCKKSRVLFGARRARRAARGPTTRAAARNERDPPEWDVRGSSGVEKKRHKRHKRHSGHGG